jgi:hypothetical protein
LHSLRPRVRYLPQPETFHGENGLGHNAWKKLGTLLFGGDVTQVVRVSAAPMRAQALS